MTPALLYCSMYHRLQFSRTVFYHQRRRHRYHHHHYYHHYNHHHDESHYHYQIIDAIAAAVKVIFVVACGFREGGGVPNSTLSMILLISLP